MKGQFYGGTSGLQIPIPKRDFPPEHMDKSRLAYYGSHLNTIEINSSFYKLPQPKTIRRWVSEVPPDFRFTFKCWKEISHRKNLLFNSEDVRRFMDLIDLPISNRGCLLVQFPPSLQVYAQTQLGELLELLSASTWRLAVEFRHPSWYSDSCIDLLIRHQAAVVIQDMPKSASPFELTADDFVYLRFHGPSGNYKGSYTESFLWEYSRYINEWQEDGKTVYCYFNNTAGAALANLSFLQSCLF